MQEAGSKRMFAAGEMPACPKCGADLSYHPKLDGKLCCRSCKTIFGEASIARHWTGDGYDMAPATSPSCTAASAPHAGDGEDAEPEREPWQEQEQEQEPAPRRRVTSGGRVVEGGIIETHLPEFSLAALGCGIAALCASIFPFLNVIVYVPAAVGIVLAVLALRNLDGESSSVKATSVAAIGCSVLAVIMALVINAGVMRAASGALGAISAPIAAITGTSGASELTPEMIDAVSDGHETREELERQAEQAAEGDAGDGGATMEQRRQQAVDAARNLPVEDGHPLAQHMSLDSGENAYQRDEGKGGIAALLG